MTMSMTEVVLLAVLLALLIRIQSMRTPTRPLFAYLAAIVVLAFVLVTRMAR